MESERNKQLTSIIGRRLRESCRTALDAELPPAIARQLAALRDSEQDSDGESDGPQQTSNGRDDEDTHAAG